MPTRSTEVASLVGDRGAGGGGSGNNLLGDRSMKERGILFTPENYTKVEDGVKTQTRRIVKLTDSGRVKLAGSTKNWHLEDPDVVQACPFGTIGDRLYVKEGLQKSPGGLVQYRRDLRVIGWAEWTWQKRHLSPLHMPKWAARLWLEITYIQVQRLTTIPQLDAMEEGADGLDYKASFKDIWQSIYGPGSWDENPWVWAISFKKVLR
jgi:hypothetical protein